MPFLHLYLFVGLSIYSIFHLNEIGFSDSTQTSIFGLQSNLNDLFKFV